ncbi:hypothetical protein LCGC14_0957880 [marine sediment metagenome]|uniref:Peptidase M14 domain-containing protein n=1 Tax=marine sediment metagenome TaxID=412755 RepID=A0A0F9NF96_9ZZZZ|nr:hypothetical protein [Candidatus Aminicenantes bacterium]
MFNKKYLALRSIIPSILIFLLGLGISFAQKVPLPEEILGFKVGADFHLADYNQALEYFRALEKSSPRMKVFEMGKTEMGKPMIYAVITSEDNMAKLDHYKEISRKLALVKGLTDEEARRLAAEGKAVVWISVAVHAWECATAQHALQLAYDLVASEDPETRFIRDNTIFLLVFANPDGMQMLAEWYLPNLGTPYEMSPMPWLYNKYVGHDDNREFYMYNMAETKNMTRTINQEWYPIILYDHHQTAPDPARIWIPPNGDPINPNMHPLITRGINLLGSTMGYAFDREGKQGAIARFAFEFWPPFFLDTFGYYFHIISIMTETSFYGYATPHFYTLNDFPEAYRDFTPSVFYPNPWKGGWWRMSDAVEYCLTASKAVLLTAAKYREEFLYDKYQMGRDTIARFQNEPPYAWIIPQAQWDSPVAARLLNNMIFSGINVYKAKESFVSDGISYPAGTYIIPMNQPFALFVKAVFEEQAYPDLTKHPTIWQGITSPQKFPDAYLPPYDMVGWTLSYQMGVKVSAANTPLEASLEPLKEVVPQAGRVESRAGYAYLISPKKNNSFIAANRILKKGGQILWAKESFSSGGKSHPPGTLIVLSKSVSRSFMDSLARELHLTIGGTGNRVAAKTYKLIAPRIALYKSWTANMDEGWTRWLFEQYEFPFTNIHDAEVRAGDLGKRYDVLVIPSMSTDAIVNGHKPGTIPPQYVGGITNAGIMNIKKFVDGGGTLVTLRRSCLFALDKLGLPVNDALKDLKPPSPWGAPEPAKPAKFACPGSVLRMEFNSEHPVAYGMPEEAPGMFYQSTAFDILSSFEEKMPVAIAKFSGENLLMSGYLKGEKFLHKKAAAVDVPLGEGKVILLSLGVQNRATPHGTFKLLFNSLYYGAVK